METDMVKVSVIVPVYNGSKIIEKTVLRLLASTYRNLEIILVDDGSTDRSYQICRELAEQDKRITVCSKENGGVAEARNYGAARATGAYLCFCDQDDFVEADMYMHLVQRMQSDNSEIGMCGTGRSVNGKKSVFEISEDVCYHGEEIKEQLLYPILFKGYHVPVKMGALCRYPSIWNCMFKKSFWDRYDFRFRSYVNFEDDLLLKLDTLSRAECVSTIAYIGYYWNINLESETYAHKFVENLAEKQQLYYEDIENSVRRCVTDSDVLGWVKRVTRCKLYLDAIHILTSPYKKTNIRFIQDFCKVTIYDCGFEESIQAAKYAAKGQVRAKVLLPLLRRRMSLVSYLAEKVLDYVLWISLHSQTLTKLERIMKGRNPVYQK